MNQSPPKWADRFLRWYCNPFFLEEIEGDIYELFDRRVEEKGVKRARFKFVWDVFRFFRWSNIKRSNSKYTNLNQLMLLSNYLKLGMRNIRRNLVSSSINIFGLAIAICFAISIFIFTDVQLNMDSFHSKGDRIYQVTNYVEQDGAESLWSDSPIPLGPRLVSDFPSVESATRVEYRSASVKQGTDVFDELILFVDPVFFEMFDFPMVSGAKDVLYNKNHVVISRNMAIKYFSERDPIGQELSFKFSNGKILRLTVGAVLDKFPYNSGIAYDFFLPFESFELLDFAETNDWGFLTDATFILLQEGEDINKIMDNLDEYVALQQSSKPEWKVSSFHPFKLTEVSINSYKITSSVIGGGHPGGRIVLIIIALFLLTMACFNFMNISVVGAAKRLKEIALRKVMGSVRRQIINQFLVENILQCFFALVVGTILAYFLLVPWFDVMVPEMDIKFRTNNPMTMIVFFISLLLGVGIVSGAYPAFYISKFEVITIFKGKEKFGSKNFFSKVMLGLQFFLSVITIVGCFVFLDQSYYLNDKDWGYDPTGTVSVYVANEEQYELLRNEVEGLAAVNLITSSDYLIGRGLGVSSLTHGDKQLAIRRIGVSENYFDIFGLRLKEGRAITDLNSDQSNGVVVNEKFVDAMAWSDQAIGQTFDFDSTRYTVIGVVTNFHYDDFYSEVGPVMFHGLEPGGVHYLTLETSSHHLAEVDQALHGAWSEIAQDDPYDRIFQEDVFNDFYLENKSNIAIILLITVIAIILACLGLYGLLSYNVQGKLKEFSVRKVLGAESRAIVQIISKQYFWVLLIAFILGAPLGSFGMMNLVVHIYPDYKPVTALPFLVAMLIIIVTLIITVIGQINKAIKVNPAELLRNE